MSHIFKTYFNFILRPLPNHEVLKGVEVNEKFTEEILIWTVFFTAAYFLSKYLLPILFPKWYSNLTDRKKREFPTYFLCNLHHYCMVPIAWMQVIQDFYRSSEELETVSYSVIGIAVTPFVLGWLIADTFCSALPDFYYTGNLEYIVHHVMLIWLVTACLFVNGHLLRFIPHALMTETSSAFFNSAWLLRTVDSLKGSAVVTAVELLFAIAFLFTRVINLPIVFYAMYISKYSDELGWARITFIPFVALQWFWFGKIVLGIASRLRGGSSQHRREESKTD